MKIGARHAICKVERKGFGNNLPLSLASFLHKFFEGGELYLEDEITIIKLKQGEDYMGNAYFLSSNVNH